MLAFLRKKYYRFMQSNLVYKVMENKVIYTVWWKVKLFQVDRAVKRTEKSDDHELAYEAWEDQGETYQQYHFEKKMGVTW